MSLKPLKKSDMEKAKSKMLAKKSEKRPLLPPRILIVSEGTKTEPFYFEYFAKIINDSIRKYSANPRIIVDGTGRNTSGLYDHLENNYGAKELAGFQEIWLVYDKDDFPKDRFDNVALKAKNQKNSRFKAAWSNESFELWLLWHFQGYCSNNHRKDYIRKLKEYVPNYAKGNKEVYEEIIQSGDVKEAIRRAKKQIKYYTDQGEETPSKMNASSTVYLLVERLNKEIKKLDTK